MPEQKEPVSGTNEQALQAEIERLNKIIQALMNRAERNASLQGSDFNLFQTAITLEDQVRQQTLELEETRLETDKITRVLRERENNYRLLLENSPVSIHEIDMNGRIISMSRAGILMHGLKEEGDVQGSLYLDGVSAADRERIGELLAKAYTGETCQFEFKAYGPREPIFKSCFVPIKNKMGKVEKLMGITEDITEHKKEEEALRKSEEKFKQLAEVFPETIFEADMKGDVTYANEHGLKHFGLTQEDVAKGINIYDMVSPHDRKLALERIQSRIQGAHKGYLEYQALKKDGSLFHALALSVPIMSDGTPVGIRGFILDITKRKQMEEALRESEERIRAITNSAKDAITMMDNNGNISYWNPAAEYILGYTSAEAIGRNLHALLAPERFLPSYLAALPEFQKTGKGNAVGKTLELAARRKDGREIDVALSLSAVKIEGAWQAVGIMRDITEHKQVEAELIHIKKAVESSSDAIGISDPQGHHIYQNKAFTELFEYTLAEISAAGGGPAVYANKDIAGKVFEAIMSGKSWSGEVEMISRSGRKLPVVLHADAIKDESGQIVGLIGVHTDITERKQAEEALARLNQQNELILKSAAEGILGLDLQGNHMFVNSAAAKMLGYEVEELIGLPSHITWHHTKSDGSPYPKEECKILSASVDGMVHRVSTEVFWRKDGTSFPVEYASTPIYEQGRTTGVVVTFADITERKKTEEQIQHLATHDLLTDLPSLRLARDRMSVAINMARRYKKAVAVMFIDLDGFKAVNDTIGHEAGDYVLKQVAQRLLSCVRETDTVARVGGDEFLIIATEINSPENAAQIAEKVIETVSQPIIFKRRKAIVGASIGIALFPDHGEDMDRLIKQADKAMYKVKNAGKNGFRFVNTATE